MTGVEKSAPMPIELNPPPFVVHKESEDVDYADALAACVKPGKADAVRELLGACSAARRAMLSALEPKVPGCF